MHIIIVVAHIIFLINPLVALFMLANKILASVVHSKALNLTFLSETLDHDLSPAETSTIAPVTAPLVATSITTMSVVPKITLPTNAMGSPPHLCEVSRPDSRTPLQPLVITWELVNHLDKAIVKQLISDLLCYWLPWTSISINCQAPQLNLTAQTLLTKVSKQGTFLSKINLKNAWI